MKKNYVIGVDIGTSSTKAVLFDETGKLMDRHAVSYELDTDDSGKAEQDPDKMVAAVKTAVKNLINESTVPSKYIHAVAFSSAMHSVILIDKDNKPLTPAITWADQRSAGAAETLKKEYDSQEIYRQTGTPVHPMSPFVKIYWLQQNKPELTAQTAVYADIKSYVFYQLFDEWVVDESLASGTGLYSVQKHDWEAEAMDVVQLTAEKLPKVVAETFTLHNEGLAKELGLHANPAFVIGGSDGALANVGIQALGKNEVTVTVGTSGAVRKLVPEFQIDQSGRTFCYSAAGPFVIGGAVNNGGKVVEWAYRQFAKENESFSDFVNLAKEVSPGAEGLLFLPYLLGERAPLWENNLFGDFVGLTINHTRETIIRAILEGLAMNLAGVYEAIAEAEDVIYVTGGLAAEPLWCQLLADILERKVCVTKTIEGSGLGAAILGMKAIGLQDSLELHQEKTITQSYEPEKVYQARYQEFRNLFYQANQQLMESYEALLAWKGKYQEI